MGRAVPHPGVLNTGASEKATGKRRREEKKSVRFGLDLQTTATVEGEPDSYDNNKN